MEAIIHCKEKFLEVRGRKLNLMITTTGHLALNITGKDQINLNGKNVYLTEDLQKKDIAKLHIQFNHPSKEKLTKLIIDTGRDKG